jgi:carotenoid 1,2-hydratase
MNLAATLPGDDMPPFDVDVPQMGYRWWYVDGISECGRRGIVIIAFIGSVFSPYYYLARARGNGNPYEHCSLNVALYEPGRRRWAMTERARNSLHIEPARFRIGRSSLERSGEQLLIDINERSAPFAQPVRGQVKLTLPQINGRAFELDCQGRHTWQPVAASALIEVRFTEPGVTWRGHGYLDSNAGAEPIESGFDSWDWCRMPEKNGTRISYDVVDCAGTARSLALYCGADGSVETTGVAPRHELGRTGWRIDRAVRCPEGVRVGKTLEDTPFYARSVLHRGVDDTAPIMHESLSLRRFRSPWVRALLPFRMPRITRRL